MHQGPSPSLKCMNATWKQCTVTTQCKISGSTTIVRTVAHRAALMRIGSPGQEYYVFLTPPVSVTGLGDIWHDLHIEQKDCPLDRYMFTLGIS